MKVETILLSSLATAVVAQQQAIGQMAQPIPQMTQLQIPAMADEVPMGQVPSLLDFSRVSSMDATTPMSYVHVYEPETDRFAHLSMNVFRAGSMYYIPVCSVGTTPDQVAAMDTTFCQSAIPLSPVPRNAAMAMIRMLNPFHAMEFSPMGQMTANPAGAMPPAFGGMM